ncbi:hypothetical protein B0A52_05291 [Exophiala mesophila]|uniref:6-phosphogluconolactonase n=1 Tax=Exophiala mesophila TaxID=212818 RepID=A0A438N4U1_EXOME|nr:hypothetical protein B0A52_05291 [Exophiala mesophila]
MHLISASTFVIFLLSLFLTAVSATDNGYYLYVSGYDGVVRSMALYLNSTIPRLEEIATSKDCGKNPSWFAIFRDNRTMICLDEGFSGNGSVNYLEIGPAHDLKLLDSSPHDKSPVHAQIFQSRVFVSFFGGPPGTHTPGGIQLYDIVDNKLTTARPWVNWSGPNTTSNIPQQDVPRAHGAFLDTLERNIVVMDYGKDGIRTFTSNGPNSTNSTFEPVNFSSLPKGSGPRHAIFSVDANKEVNRLYVLSELANTITTFEATYDDKKVLHLSPPIHVISTFGRNATTEQMTYGKAAEIQGHNQFIVVSNRNATIDGPGVFMESDSLVTFRITADGSLDFVQSVAVGGLFPRSFSISPRGDKVAVAAQTSSRLIILRRDPVSGWIGPIIASHNFDTKVDGKPAGVSAVIWDT